MHLGGVRFVLGHVGSTGCFARWVRCNRLIIADVGCRALWPPLNGKACQSSGLVILEGENTALSHRGLLIEGVVVWHLGDLVNPTIPHVVCLLRTQAYPYIEVFGPVIVATILLLQPPHVNSEPANICLLGSKSRTSIPSKTGSALGSCYPGRAFALTGCVADTDSSASWIRKETQYPTGNCW